MPLKNDFVDADATVTVHAAHHNALATAVNAMGGGGAVPRASGRYYNSVLQLSTATYANVAFGSNFNYLPFLVPNAITIDRIGVYVVVVGSVANQLRLGIYSDSNGTPGALLLDAGTVDTTTTGPKEITISQALPAGVVWLAFLGNAAGSGQGITSSALPLLGFSALANSTIANGFYQQTGVTFASGFPSTAAPTGLSGTTTTPVIYVRVA